MAADVPCGLGRQRWQEWRSPTNGVGNSDGDGKIQWKKQRKTIKEPWSWTWRRPSSGSVFLWCGPGRRNSVSQGRSCECCAVCGYFEHQRRVQFEGCVAEPLQSITAILPGSKWSCLLLRVVLQDALNEVTKNYPPVEVEGS